jgi:hypothetical protein
VSVVMVAEVTGCTAAANPAVSFVTRKSRRFTLMVCSEIVPRKRVIC